MHDDTKHRKALLAQTRLMCNSRDMAEGEASLYWQTYIDAIAHLPTEVVEKTCKRIIRYEKWFPTVSEFLAHAKGPLELHNTPTREQRIEQQRRETEQLLAGDDPWKKITGTHGPRRISVRETLQEKP